MDILVSSRKSRMVTRKNLECPRSFPFMRLLEVIFLLSIERLNWLPVV